MTVVSNENTDGSILTFRGNKIPDERSDDPSITQDTCLEKSDSKENDRNADIDTKIKPNQTSENMDTEKDMLGSEKREY